MSAEAPKETGIIPPITPQKPAGGFSGLEDFAAKFQQGIDEGLIAREQQEVDRINAKVTSHSDAVAAQEGRRRVLEQE